jgi:hypothetical protein
MHFKELSKSDEEAIALAYVRKHGLEMEKTTTTGNNSNDGDDDDADAEKLEEYKQLLFKSGYKTVENKRQLLSSKKLKLKI